MPNEGLLKATSLLLSGGVLQAGEQRLPTSLETFRHSPVFHLHRIRLVCGECLPCISEIIISVHIVA